MGDPQIFRFREAPVELAPAAGRSFRWIASKVDTWPVPVSADIVEGPWRLLRVEIACGPHWYVDALGVGTIALIRERTPAEQFGPSMARHKFSELVRPGYPVDLWVSNRSHVTGSAHVEFHLCPVPRGEA